MLEHSLIIALLVLSIWYTMQEGEIFADIGYFLYKHLPKKIHPAVFECNVCMSVHYGSVLYVIMYGVNWQWPIVVIAAMGINIVINKWSPEKDEEPKEVPGYSFSTELKYSEDELTKEFNAECEKNLESLKRFSSELRQLIDQYGIAK